MTIIRLGIDRTRSHALFSFQTPSLSLRNTLGSTQALTAMSLPLKWRENEQLAETWPQLVWVGVEAVNRCVANDRVIASPCDNFLLKSETQKKIITPSYQYFHVLVLINFTL